MGQPMWKKLACMGLIVTAGIGLIMGTTILSGCGNQEKVAVVDYQKIEMKSAKVQTIEKEIEAKNKEIGERLSAVQQQDISDEELQQKYVEAQQEQAIFIQSKQKQLQSLIEAQCQKIAKDKGYTIIMRSGMVPDGATDITDEVLTGLD